MANQIGSDDHNASDWFQTKKLMVARRIAIMIIFIDHE